MKKIIAVFITVSMIIFFVGVASANLDNGLVAYYPFSGNSNDESGNGNNGTVNGAILNYDKFGNANSSYSFDGVNDYIEVPHSASLNMSPGSVTITAWVSRTSMSWPMHIVGKRVSCGSIAIQLAIGNGAVASEYVLLNTWTHLAVTVDGPIYRHFVNGQLVLTTNYPWAVTNTAPLKIGNSGSCQPFAGSIDEVRIYNRALSNSEVQQLSNLDSDGDHVLDVSDNCPNLQNQDQEDNDRDGQGDVCDADDDNDSVLDFYDNCPFTYNYDQTDTDLDGAGDVCDADLDNDGVENELDNCPIYPNIDQTDTDNDGIGDECDFNDDNDAILDVDDNCPTIFNNDQADLDGDGIGDACDIDIDGDGVTNSGDNCPSVSNTSQDDTDSDGLGDSCDENDDNDGYLDDDDNCPLIVNDQNDLDSDGKGDVCDADLDGDGVANDIDNCSNVANSSQNDLDEDGLGDYCDPDIDGDGVANGSDLCAGTPLGAIVGTSSGCSIAQLCPCYGPMGTTDSWRNHGKYVSCVARSSESFVEMELITDAEKDAIVSEAAVSVCGHKN